MNEQAGVLEQLAAALLKIAGNGGTAYKAVSSTPTTTYGHGNGGLFSAPGLEQPVFSAFALPHRGLAARLPAYPARTQNPLFGILTGVTDTSGSNPTNVCDEPKTAGLSKLCTNTYVFGHISLQTQVYDINRAGKLADRADHLDLMLMNSPATDGNFMMPTMPGMASLQNTLRNEIAKSLYEFGVSWQREFARLIYAGNPANNTAGNGYMEFRGLDLLINTGHVDAITDQACAAADSLIVNFNNVNVTSDSAGIVRTIVGIYRYLRNTAEQTGLNPARWAITMPYGLFYELVQVWPIAYSTYRVTGQIPTGSTNFVQSSEILAMRDAMMGDMFTRTGQYLLIDGEKVEVIIDDAITETNVGGGVFGSDIYFVPLTVMGRVPVTYWEYFPYDIPGGSVDMGNVFAPDGSYFASDGGRFLWHRKPPTNWCVQMMAKMEPRLLLLTPYIAARLENVRYTPFIHQRDWDPDAPSFVNGGRTNYIGFGPSYNVD